MNYFIPHIVDLLIKNKLSVPDRITENSDDQYHYLFSLLKKLERYDYLTSISVSVTFNHPNWRALNMALDILIRNHIIDVENFAAVSFAEVPQAMAYGLVALSNASLLDETHLEDLQNYLFAEKNKELHWRVANLLSIAANANVLDDDYFKRILKQSTPLNEDCIQLMRSLYYRKLLDKKTFLHTLYLDDFSTARQQLQTYQPQTTEDYLRVTEPNLSPSLSFVMRW